MQLQRSEMGVMFGVMELDVSPRNDRQRDCTSRMIGNKYGGQLYCEWKYDGK